MFGRFLASLAAIGFCLPPSLFAATASPDHRPAVADVALIHSGVLTGQVVDPQGAALQAAPVSIRKPNREIDTVWTDRKGRFSFIKLHGGVHQVVAAGSHRTYRLWAPGTAPPFARQEVLIVSGEDGVRGQHDNAPALGEFANRLVIAGIVSTAVAIPIIINEARRPSSP